MKKEVSVYIHIPFCKKICPYCDFCKVFYEEKLIDRYLTCLEKEIKKYYQNEVAETIYIGGGTPSCLKERHLIRLFQILTCFRKKTETEYTMECNIEDLTQEKIALMKTYGVNRISVGVQTSIPRLQKQIGRVVSKDTIKKNLSLLSKAGFSNVNVDLMYAFPFETVQELEEDLAFFKTLPVSHISTYSLQIEPHTVFSFKNISPISTDLDRKMYDLLCKTLKEAGYMHYEISNFAKPGFASKHNLAYWNNKEYYGFGAGASFYRNGVRGTHSKSIYHYFNEKEPISLEVLTKEDEMDYFVLLGLRKKEGISKDTFFSLYQEPLEKVYSYSALIEQGFLEEKDSFLKIKEEYFYVMNAILVKLLATRKNG